MGTMRIIRDRIEYVLKHSMAIQKAYRRIMSLVFRVVGFFIKTDEKLVLLNGLGRKYNDSPKAIFEYLIASEQYRNYRYVWALDEPEKYDIPQCSKVRMDTIRYFLIALRAKYWISCVNIERGLKFKKKGTRYLNTWHGVPLKLIGNAVNGRRDFDFSHVDVFCHSGEYEKHIYEKDLNVLTSSLLLSGLPRNDALYRVTEQQIIEFRRMLNIPEGKKVILYAPTWRDSSDGGRTYSIKPPIEVCYWQRELEDDYVLLLRTHSYTNRLIGIQFTDFVRDVSSYPEINDLLAVSDVLISDYSSVIFDYSILERPIICFGYDYDQYALDRGLYVDLEQTLPGGVLRSQEAVVNKIKSMNYESECRKTAEFRRKYISTTGSATRLCIEALFV